MPRFWRFHSSVWHPISAAEFRLTELALVLLAFFMTYAATRRRNKLAVYFFFGFCVAMLLNAFWHIALTIYLCSYAPGAVTAVIVVLPVTGYLLANFSRIRPDYV